MEAETVRSTSCKFNAELTEFVQIVMGVEAVVVGEVVVVEEEGAAMDKITGMVIGTMGMVGAVIVGEPGLR